MSAKNAAEATLSIAGTMVWSKRIVMAPLQTDWSWLCQSPSYGLGGSPGVGRPTRLRARRGRRAAGTAVRLARARAQRCRPRKNLVVLYKNCWLVRDYCPNCDCASTDVVGLGHWAYLLVQ